MFRVYCLGFRVLGVHLEESGKIGLGGLGSGLGLGLGLQFARSALDFRLRQSADPLGPMMFKRNSSAMQLPIM